MAQPRIDTPAVNGTGGGAAPGGAVDVLGFALPQLTAEQAADRRASSRQSEVHIREWDRYAASGVLPGPADLKSLIRKGGIPHKHRTWVWAELSGANALKASKPAGYFEGLVASADKQSKALHQIELDLPRTFPEHPWMHSSEGQTVLRAVLSAYSTHNPKAGYCQGLNFVAGTMLLATDRQPETAFWLLVALLERILYPNMYAPYLPGFQVEMKALARLVAKKLPSLYRRLENLGCEMTILATDWFLCLFVTTLPHEVGLRVLDCLFCEGSKILYRMSLALLKLNQPLLMVHDNAGDVLYSLKQAVGNYWSTERLLRTGFNRIGGLPMAKIQKYRLIYQPEMDTMVRDREAARRKQEFKDADRERAREVAASSRSSSGGRPGEASGVRRSMSESRGAPGQRETRPRASRPSPSSASDPSRARAEARSSAGTEAKSSAGAVARSSPSAGAKSRAGAPVHGADGSNGGTGSPRANAGVSRHSPTANSVAATVTSAASAPAPPA